MMMMNDDVKIIGISHDTTLRFILLRRLYARIRINSRICVSVGVDQIVIGLVILVYLILLLL